MTKENQTFVNWAAVSFEMTEDQVIDNVITAFIARKTADEKLTGQEGELFEFHNGADGLLLQGRQLYEYILPLYLAGAVTARDVLLRRLPEGTDPKVAEHILDVLRSHREGNGINHNDGA